MVNILSIFLAFLENMNFNSLTSNDFLKTLPKDIRSESCLRKEMKAIDHIVSLHSYEIQVDYMDTSNQRRYSSIADCCTRPIFKMANFSSNSLIFVFWRLCQKSRKWPLLAALWSGEVNHGRLLHQAEFNSSSSHLILKLSESRKKS